MLGYLKCFRATKIWNNPVSFSKLEAKDYVKKEVPSTIVTFLFRFLPFVTKRGGNNENFIDLHFKFYIPIDLSSIKLDPTDVIILDVLIFLPVRVY